MSSGAAGGSGGALGAGLCSELPASWDGAGAASCAGAAVGLVSRY